ncbi:MAG: cyclic 2,3-diphosphoglycerate synthase [Thermococcaceae archaeon]|jgi:cyclic 2,3-diphosphoglycerate synthetase|uniref:2,3-phosphoglycerate synthetase n=1 Tax=unclassified Thermococcus TaxID=2627626 RepID=UPI0005B2A9C4|nr:MULTISPECIES: 2,3-phosphoglycerate synthetase [unclassified Thermococcus]MDK2782557.1 cyclic 2,3-diphosphoglycerate synthase [Thermococcaceae archaeon]MDK2853600.1 cyclic 2,3-diphosphoglycerate synthase [Thermococcaceae archaeon]MDK2983981.1 cyclic 2,3-diphosphoglycerate synthase [Thermococcaceae archaeon]MDN5320862.1 cyclic 2,3-diphosphoglycerate synthase [Thermococcaceae archaeon]MPW38284.1 2,3-diphosphoglycerate synthetase [Thermococcus sp. 101 C5]
MRMVLIDGEHYPDVTAWAIKQLKDVCCAVFLGGTEKIGDIKSLEKKIGVKLYSGEDYLIEIERAIKENKIEEVIDLSDEPVVNYEDRFRIAAVLLKHGIKYRGADFEFSPKKMLKISKPSITILGTGKRVGKTAVSGFVARTLKQIAKPIIVTMGRGGPEEPEIIEGDKIEITPEFLVKIAESGKHAASDHFEDALTARVLTIGCRRCGGGMAGFSFFDIVDKGVKLAEKLEGDIVILEGSGATFPAVKADKYITVVGATQRIEFIRSYFGPFRVGLADLIVVTLADMVSKEKLQELQRVLKYINPKADIHLTAFKPRPLGDVRGKKALLVMTAPPEGLEKAAKHLEENYGVEIVGKSPNLSNRAKLREDLKRFDDYDTVIVELKAAAVDVVTKEVLQRGKEIIYLDNEPVNMDGKDLKEAILKIGRELRGDVR